MADKATPPADLTSTLNLRQLRSIPQANQSDDLYKSLSAEAQNVISNLPKGEGILLILKGAGIGARYLLDAAQTKLGRDMSNEIILDDITVSRSHALITKSNGYRLKDLGSLIHLLGWCCGPGRRVEIAGAIDLLYNRCT